MCMGLITIMYSQQGLEYFLLLYYTISMYYYNMYNELIIIKKPKLIKKQVCFLHSSRSFEGIFCKPHLYEFRFHSSYVSRLKLLLL